MSKQINPFDSVSERVILSALINHGEDAHYAISAYVDHSDIYLPENRIIFSAIIKLINEDKIKKPDILTISNLISSIDKESYNKYAIPEYISALSQDVVNLDNIDPFCKIIKRLSVVRQLKTKLADSQKILDNVTGEESILEIIQMAEKPFSDFVQLVNNSDDVVNFNDHLADYAHYLGVTKPTVQGIKSGFDRFDHANGGGLVSPGFHVVGARSGGGKSFFLLNVAQNAIENGAPVLLLDTELTDKMQMDRLLALKSQVKIDRIKNGSFVDKPEEKNKVTLALTKHMENSFSYQNISGKHHAEWLSTARKWILKTVGLNQHGKAKKCLLVLDYIKLMSLEHSENYKEYQYLGQLATDLHNFCIEYDIPCIAAVQTNRDGISRDDQGVIAGSDRIIGLSSSCWILKHKDAEDYADDPIINGNMKLVCLKSRFGAGLQSGEYINIKANLSMAKMTEGTTNLENRSS